MNNRRSEITSAQLEELFRLREEMRMCDEDFELGKKSPRELAIKWLCRAVIVSSYDWKNETLLMQAIDRLIALDSTAKA